MRHRPRHLDHDAAATGRHASASSAGDSDFIPARQDRPPRRRRVHPATPMWPSVEPTWPEACGRIASASTAARTHVASAIGSDAHDRQDPRRDHHPRRRAAPTSRRPSSSPSSPTPTSNPIRTAWERRDPDLDPQLVWRGKDLADWSDLDRPGAADLPPGADPPQGADRGPPRQPPRRPQGRPRPRPLRPLRPHRRRPRGRGRVLPPLPQVVEPDDPRRQPRRHGLARRARGPARPGPGDLHRPALRHPLQLELPVVDHLARRQGRQPRPPDPRARAGEGLPRHLAATASTPTSPTCATA